VQKILHSIPKYLGINLIQGIDTEFWLINLLKYINSEKGKEGKLRGPLCKYGMRLECSWLLSVGNLGVTIPEFVGSATRELVNM
jgi:hypothetical protein